MSGPPRWFRGRPSGSGDRSGFAAVLLSAAVAAVAVAGCGSSGSGSQNARTLLNQTFSGSHAVTSGVLDFSLTITPTGSKLLSGPVTLSLSGPFQSRGTGKLPASDFTIAISAMSLKGSLAVISTGTKGYVTMSGQSYQLPQSSFRKLEPSISAAAAPVGGSSSSTGSSTLQSLGINPLHWLTDPTVVGQEQVGGTQTTHIRAKVDPAVLLADLSRLAAGANVKLPGSATATKGISAKDQAKIAKEVGTPSFDVWTGNSDKTVRRLSLAVQLPVTGATSKSLGGMTSARFTLSLQYSDLNKPQTITAPHNLKPYKQFQAKIDMLLGVLGGAAAAGSGSTTTTSTATATAPAANTPTSRYSQCIAKAAGDVKQMQKCTPLLSGG